MIKKIDHVGLVVANARETIDVYCDLFGAKSGEMAFLDEMKIYSTLIEMSEDRLEIIEPTPENESIYRFLEERGGGMHHISFQVESIEKTIEDLKAKNVKVIVDQHPFEPEKKVVFVHPKYTKGVLVELFEAE